MKKLGFSLGLAVLCLALFAAPIQAGTTINVPGPYGSTIQAAINAASAGDTIIVAAGVYHERLTINKSLTLMGAQSGVDPTLAGSRTVAAAESVVDLAGLSVPNPNVLLEIPLGVKNVTVSGFTLVGGNSPLNADLSTIRAWDDDLIIEDNIITGHYGVLYKGNDRFIVNRNRITVNKVGITVQPNAAANVTLSYNAIIPGPAPASDCSALYMTGTSDSLVLGNTAVGFPAGNGFGGSNHTRLTISGNRFSGNRRAVNIWGSSTFVTIDHNTLANAVEYGIIIKADDVSITGNVVQDNGSAGIMIDKHVLATQRVTVRNNCITGNASFGLNVTPAVLMTVDALNNWWGSATGPEHPALNPTGTGDAVSDRAVFSPWLTGAAYTGGTSFAHFDPVVLQAAIHTSSGPGAGVPVRFYAGGNFIHEATTDASGAASYDWGLQPVGTYSVRAFAGGGCLASALTTIEVKHIDMIADFQVTEAKLDWKKKPDDDKAMVKGVFVLPDAAVPDPNAMTLKIGNVTFGPLAMTKVDDKKWEYKRPKGADGIKVMKIEWKKKEAKFEIHIDDADLGDRGAWANPVPISVFLGAYMGTANVPMVEHKDKWEYHK